MLHGCARIVVLASSRQGLGIAGEVTYRVPSLVLPSEAQDGALRAADAVHYPAMALFIERARAADPRFTPSDENAPIIAEVCRRLDGIPLAIELAAARVRILSPRQLRERLNERFRVLTGGSRDALPRQQTLRAMIDWSHELLDERERALFRRLGIFVNGFTLEGAVAVGGDKDLDELDVFDVLASLADKSLVLAEPDGDALRYRLLESTRAYARENLEAAGERERCAGRHLEYFRERFRLLYDGYERTGRTTELADGLKTELEDVRAALDFGLSSNNVPSGAALLAAVEKTWRRIGLEHEGETLAQAYLAALADREPLLRARRWTMAAYFAGSAGRTTRMMDASREAVACAKTCGDPGALGEALQQYARGAALSRRFQEAEAALAQAEALPTISAAQRLRLLSLRAMVSGLSGDAKAALRAEEQLVKEYRSLGDADKARNSTLNTAEWTHALGETRRAIGLLREVLPAERASGDRRALVMMKVNLAAYLVAVDEVSEACTSAREAIREIAAHDTTATSNAIALEVLALALALGGDLHRAARLAGYADVAMARLGFEREFTERATRDRVRAVLAEQLAPDELARYLAEGAELSPDAAIALALEDP
ncbi:MAG: hypothetical protein NVS3B10_21140 [Polyangiales bacterium]